jgi:hypothetical protein
MSVVPEQANPYLRAAWCALVAVALGACGGSDPDLPEGENLSASALQLSVTPAARVVIEWDSVDGSNRYRVSVDRDGEGEGSATVLGDYFVAGSDIPDRQRFFIFNVAPTVASTVAWDSVQFTVESCVDEVVDGEFLGEECIDVPDGFSLAPVPPGNILFEWERVDDANFYRLFADLDGKGNYEQLAADLPPDQIFFPYDFSALKLNWEAARFMLESCTDDGCANIGEQRVRGISSFSVGVFRPPTPLFNPNYGASIAASEDGSTLAVGSPGDSEYDCEEIFGVDQVDVADAIEEAGGVFPACTYIIPTDTLGNPADPDDDFVPPESLTEVIGAAGAVYIYTRDVLGWLDTVRLEAPNPREGDNLGWAVALSDDGLTLAVASRFEDSAATGIGGEQDVTDNEALDSGAVYIYVREDGDWVLQEYIKASNTETEDLFGWQLAPSGDGNTLAVTGVLEESSSDDIDNNDLDRAGAVYTYTRTDGVWAAQDFLKPSDVDAHDLFGFSLALSADGQVLAIGALEEGSPPPIEELDGRFRVCNPISEPDAGAVYIFQRDVDVWAETAKLTASNANKGDCFGLSVALNADGSRLAVGAPLEDSDSTGVNGGENSNSQPNSGAAYVFERSGMNWAQTDYFKASNTGTPDLFGTSVALSSGGKVLVVGAIGESSASFEINGSEEFNTAPGTGAAYAFKLKNSKWKQVAFIKASQPQAAANFGWKIVTAQNGSRVAVSAPGWELGTGYPGAVFAY